MPSALELADETRLRLSPTLDAKRRSQLGQFMTPTPVATFMASMFDQLPENIRLLDAGAGVGALTAAFVDEALSRPSDLASIEVIAYEVDAILADELEKTLKACSEKCGIAGVKFIWQVVRDDYILRSSEPLLSESGGFNCAIMNPPYAKINTGSRWRAALRQLGIETVNLYTAFVGVALHQLDDGGQLVAITPRSFCNGPYYAPFRRDLLALACLRRIHLYGSRKSAFKDDAVLQENVIYHVVRGAEQPEHIALSTSDSPSDPDVRVRKVGFRDVVRPYDPQCFIRLSSSEEDADLALRVQTLPCTLAGLGITVSTGRVVDFRARPYLRKQPEPGSWPLIYPAHFDQGFVAWPRPETRKNNALARSSYTEPQVVPEGTYVLTKRFSAKEEKRRLVAAVYAPERVAKGHVGFENHLNYFHENGGGLPPVIARGLAVFLNSTAVDQYFRIFSGHTQVNATDLRTLHYPTREKLERLAEIVGDTMPPQNEIDEAVEELL